MAGVRIKISTDEAQLATKKLYADLAKLGSIVKQDSAEAKILEQRLLKKLGADQARASIDSLTRSLGLTKKEVTELEKKVGIFQKTATGLGKIASNLGVQLTAAFAIGAAVTFVKKSYTLAKEYESALIDMGRVTDRTFADIRKDIAALGPELGSQTELMRGYYAVMSAGISDPKKALDLLTTASKTARAAHIEQSEVVKALTKVMFGFSGEVKSAAEASDLLFAIDAAGQTSVAELVPVIGDLASISHQAGVSAQEMGAAIATMSQTAGSTSQAATQYQALLMGIIKPQERMKDLLDTMRVASGKALVQQLGFAGALKRVKEEADKANKPLGDFFRSAEALLGIGPMMASNFKDYAEKFGIVTKSVDGSAKAFREYEETAASASETFDNTLAAAMKDFGEIILPAVTSALKEMSKYLIDNKTDLKKFLIELQVEMIRLYMLSLKFRGSFSEAQMLLTGPGRLLGIESSTKNFEAAADANIKLAQQYKEMDKLLEKLAIDYINLENASKGTALKGGKTTATVPGGTVSGKTTEKSFKILTDEERKAIKEKEELIAKSEEEIVDLIRKNRIEIDTMEQTQLEKDLARIAIKVVEYKKAGVSQLALYEMIASERELASAKAVQVEIENSHKAGEAAAKQYADIEELAQKKFNKQEEDVKTYKALVSEQADFAATENERAINKIVADYDGKMRKLNELQEGGNLKYKEYMNLKVKYNAEKNAAILQQEITALDSLASFYENIPGYEEKFYETKLAWIEKVRLADIEATKDTEAANRKSKKAITELDYKIFSAKTAQIQSGLADMESAFASISNMYEEGTSQQKNWAAAAEAMMIAQKAVAVVNAVAAVAASAAAPWPAGFVSMAAMLAAMASLLGSIGAGIGGGGGSSSAPPPKASTVLGAEAGVKSESASKSFELLTDTYSMEYEKLTKIYTELKELNSNITGIVTNILRTGTATGDWAITFASEMDNYTSTVGDILSQAIGIFSADPFTTMTHQILEWLGGNKLSQFFSKIFGGEVTVSVPVYGVAIDAVSIQSIIDGIAAPIKNFAYVVTHEEGGWFSSDTDTGRYEYTEADEQLVNLFTKIYSNLSNAIIELAKGFGTDVEAAMAYIFPDVKIDVAGLDAEGISKAINTFISDLGDTAAEALFGSLIKEYQEIGEGLLETAVRLYSDKEIIMELLETINQSFSGTMPAAIAFSEYVIKLAGDLEALTDAFSGYYDKFFTDEEKYIKLTKDLGEQFDLMKMSVPDSREGFRAVIEGLDLTTESGQKAFITLMKLAGFADEYYSYMEDEVESLSDLNVRLLVTQGNALVSITDARRKEMIAATDAEKLILAQIYAQEDANKTRDLNLQLMEVEGHSIEALAIKRKLELATLSESDQIIQQSIYDAEDANKTEALRLQLLQASGDAMAALNASREDELATLSATDAAIQSQIYAARDANKLASMHVTLLRAQHKEEEALAEERKLALAGLDTQKQKDMQQAIWDLTDAAEAQAKATEALEKAAAELEEIRSVTQSVYVQYYNAQAALAEAQGTSVDGFTAEQWKNRAIFAERSDIIAKIPWNAMATQTMTLRDFQWQIWAIEDAAAALTETGSSLDLLNQELDLNIQLLNALGMAEESLAMSRMKELRAMDSSLHYTQLQIWAIEDVSSSIQTLKDRAKTLTDWANEMNRSALAPVQSAAMWESEYSKKRLAALAAGATTEDISAYLSAAQEYLEFQRTYGTNYQAQYALIMGDIGDLSASTTTALSVAEAQLDVLKDQTAAMIAIGEQEAALLTSLINAVLAGVALPPHGKGGLTSGISIAGEAGPEWVVPTYEPQRSNFLASVGVDTDAIGRSIAKYILASGVNSGGDILVKVEISEREIGNATARQLSKNGDLQKSVERVARRIQ